LLAATVRSFAHVPLGISDRNTLCWFTDGIDNVEHVYGSADTDFVDTERTLTEELHHFNQYYIQDQLRLLHCVAFQATDRMPRERFMGVAYPANSAVSAKLRPPSKMLTGAP